MHLGFALFKYFPYAGLQRDFMRVAQAALARGHSVTVFTREWQGEVPDGMDVVLGPNAGFRNHVKDRKFAEWLMSVRSNYPIDVWFGFNRMPGMDYYFAADVCYRFRRKQRWWARLNGRARHFLRFEEAVFASGRDTKIFALAEKQKQEYQECYGTEEERFTIVPPGISREFAYNDIDASVARKFVIEELGLAKKGEENTVFLHVGSDFRRKGVDRCIKALAGAPCAHVAIVGQGRVGKYRRLAATLGVEDRVHFIGPSEKVRNWMLGSDALLHPAREENTGTVLAEALVAGLPVIASGETGYAYHIARSGAGVALPRPFSQLTLNETVQLACDNGKRSDWHRAALEYATTEDFYNLMTVILDTIERDAGA